MTFHRPAKLLVLGLVAMAANPVHARVAACVLDGGGDVSGRACGVERGVEEIRQIYRSTHTQTDLGILTGSGQVGQPACTTPLLGCVGSNCGGDAIGYDDWNASTGTYTRHASTVTQNLTLRVGAGEHLSAGTHESFDSNCLFDSAHPPAQNLPVCNFWNLNHGLPGGSVFYQPDPSTPTPLMTTENLRSKADHCDNFRFVTHSCYGAQLGALIYGADGRVIPGRCGMSASPPGFQALGIMSTNPSIPAVRAESRRADHLALTDHRSTVDGRPARISYPEIELMAGMASGSASSLDAMHADTARTTAFTPQGSDNPVILGSMDPYLTSDYYLAHTLHHEMQHEQATTTTYLAPTERERAQLVDSVVRPEQSVIDDAVSCFWTLGNREHALDSMMRQVSPALGVLSGNSELTADEQAAVRADLRNEMQRVVNFSYLGCVGGQPEVPVLGDQTEPPTEAEQLRRMLAGPSNCHFEQGYQRFVAERARRLQIYEEATTNATRAAAARDAICAEGHVTPCADLRALDQRIRSTISNESAVSYCEFGALMVREDRPINTTGIHGCDRGMRLIQLRNRLLAARDEASRTQGLASRWGANFESWLTTTADYRRYESVKMRFAQTMQLYRSGTPNQVRDYLNLRACETAPMGAPAPRTLNAAAMAPH